jgi:hypothetical protein
MPRFGSVTALFAWIALVRCSDPHRLRAADDMQVLLGLSSKTHAGAAKLCGSGEKFLYRSSQFRHSIRKADSGRLSVMRQRSRAIEQSPSCEVARWMPIRARRGVFGSASSVKPGAKAGDGSIQPGATAGSVRSRRFRVTDKPMTSRPGQSRLPSLAESLANVMIGFLKERENDALRRQSRSIRWTKRMSGATT